MSELNALKIRRKLGRDQFLAPREFGPDGWIFDPKQDGGLRIILTTWDYGTEHEWIHASCSRTGEMPSYDDLKLMHAAVFGDGYAYQVFTPSEHHVSIHEFALHLFGRLDGEPSLPDFTMGGASI